MKRTISSILRISLIMLGFSLPLCAQEPASNNWTLSMLRGKWQSTSFYEQSTLMFLSDMKGVIDGDPMSYTLLPGTLKVTSNNATTDYPYVLSEDQLTLSGPDGGNLTYRRSESGTAEGFLNGYFYTQGDSTFSGDMISFDGEREFDLYSKTADSTGLKDSLGFSSENGVYRVEGSQIILTFRDGTTDRALIRTKDIDGYVTGVILNDQFFGKETLAVQPPDIAYIPGIIVIGRPTPPGPPFPPDPPLPIASPTGGTRPIPSAPTPVRDFGNTRESAKGSGSSSSAPSRPPTREPGNTQGDAGRRK